jgi:hypothetical protein
MALKAQRRLAAILAVVATMTLALAAPGRSADSQAAFELREFKLTGESQAKLTRLWMEQLRQRKATDGWVPMRADMTDEMLDLVGLPPHRVLSKMRFRQPTIVDRRGRTATVTLPAVDDPAVATFAGAGWFGIRPGALLLINGEVTGWCSMAHVYRVRGSYDISTAGHCAERGATATVLAGFGNRDGVAGPVLLDFGTFAKSVNKGPGRDWALIDIAKRHQRLVTPTMAFWGGPRGMYRRTGSLLKTAPTPSADPDPVLAQSIVHYGHGTGVGAGGTPRAGAAIDWQQTRFTMFSALSFGDSGSGVNAVTGDTEGTTMEAAGIFTHFSLPWLDLMSSGVGIMAGTRATQVQGGRLAHGQIVPWPVPLDGAP